MPEVKGWLFDLYAGSQEDLVIWLLTQSDNGRVDCQLFHQAFPVTFYAAGAAVRLRQLWRYLTKPICAPEIRTCSTARHFFSRAS